MLALAAIVGVTLSRSLFIGDPCAHCGPDTFCFIKLDFEECVPKDRIMPFTCAQVECDKGETCVSDKGEPYCVVKSDSKPGKGQLCDKPCPPGTTCYQVGGLFMDMDEPGCQPDNECKNFLCPSSMCYVDSGLNTVCLDRKVKPDCSQISCGANEVCERPFGRKRSRVCVRKEPAVPITVAPTLPAVHVEIVKECTNGKDGTLANGEIWTTIWNTTCADFERNELDVGYPWCQWYGDGFARAGNKPANEACCFCQEMLRRRS